MDDLRKGSEWRRWDLHVHTKGTVKNDAFKSKDFESFCVELFKKAINANIAVIGITDYFNIENYKKVKSFVENLGTNGSFTDDEKDKIRSIFIVPNIELRMFPVTDSGRLVNIHCIFNPAFVSKIENHFFNKIKMSGGSGVTYLMNKDGLTDLGKSLESSLDDAGAYKKGLENFVVSQDSLQELLDTDKNLRSNVLVVVSNSSKDGASALQQHYDMFDGVDPSSLDGVRKSIYCISDAIFSGNEKDRSYFLGKGTDDPDVVIKKCGSLKPCIHGSDAHTEKKLFEPDKSKYCWIKADPTFDGLRQIIYEPEDRVFIGEIPAVYVRVSGNKTKYIDKLKIDQKSGYTSSNGIWFKSIEIELNKELVAIIGNKGSGKSAIADITGLLGNTHNAGESKENFSFLNKKKFVRRGYAENFAGQLEWHDGNSSNELTLDSDIDITRREDVRYLPQNYFESLTNDLEESGFDSTLKSVTFSHLPAAQKLGKGSFEELEAEKLKNIDASLNKLKEQLKGLSSEVISLESKSDPKYRKRIESEVSEKQRELNQHLKDKPKAVPNPSDKKDTKSKTKTEKDQEKISQLNDKLQKVEKNISDSQDMLNSLTVEHQDLSNIKEELQRLETDISDYVTQNKQRYKKHSLDIEVVVSANIKTEVVQSKLNEKKQRIVKVQTLLLSSQQIENDTNITSKEKAIKSSLLVQKKKLEDEIEGIKKQLSKPEREYQNYRERQRVWEEKKNAIEGSKSKPGSLLYLSEEIKYIDEKLQKDLAQKRVDRLNKSVEIFNKKKEIVDLYNLLKESVDKEIQKDEEFTSKFKMEIEAGFRLDNDFARDFLAYINKSRVGTYCRAEEKVVKDIFLDKNLLSENDVKAILNSIITSLEIDQREEVKSEKERVIKEQVTDIQEFYEFLFTLDYLKPIYELKLDGKTLDELSPGEKGALLLVFYLMIDKEDIPLIIDQPEDNLDNKSVFEVLTHFIRTAKKRRQIIIVTHNPNLAVGADAEQIIYVDIDKKGKHKFTFESGSIENPKLNSRIVEILEGTMPAFDMRKLKYHQ